MSGAFFFLIIVVDLRKTDDRSKSFYHVYYNIHDIQYTIYVSTVHAVVSLSLSLSLSLSTSPFALTGWKYSREQAT